MDFFIRHAWYKSQCITWKLAQIEFTELIITLLQNWRLSHQHREITNKLFHKRTREYSENNHSQGLVEYTLSYSDTFLRNSLLKREGIVLLGFNSENLPSASNQFCILVSPLYHLLCKLYHIMCFNLIYSFWLYWLIFILNIYSCETN